MTRLTKWLTFMLLLNTLFRAEGQTINAASCNASDVQTAFSSVTNSTTTVNIPAGTCTWTTGLPVTLVIPSGSTTLSVFGAGDLAQTGGGDATIIKDRSSHSPDNPLINIITNATTSSLFRLAGITFSMQGNANVTYNGEVYIGGNSQNIRVDHTNWTTGSYGSINFNGPVFGVVDHSTFDTNMALIFKPGSWTNGGSNGDGSWADATNLGSSRFVFIEDNVFNIAGKYINDCYTGGKFVVRYNTMNGGIQEHPTGGAGDFRGCRAFELYKNTMTLTSGMPNYPTYTGMFVDSGTGVIWGNSAPTGFENFIDALEVRTSNVDYSQTNCSGTNCSAGWGYCGTAQTGTGSTWDQAQGTSGYACIDQLGRGQGDLLTGSFPNKCDSTTGCLTHNGTWPDQALEPVYEWMDTWAPVQGYGYSFLNNNAPSQIQQNRDIYLWCNASSPTGCTSFNGTSGVGSGLLSARPGTCTKGVAYWATDQGAQGTLYQCSSTNTWTVYYTPYTYPHPLTQSGGDPKSPQNLQAAVQ